MAIDSESFRRSLAELENQFNSLEPELELTVHDHELDVEGHVVVWCTRNAIDGPLGRCGKGGTRITPTLTLDEVRMLARTQSLKNAAAGLPLGGAKSGLRADPDAEGFERQYRRFVRLLAPALRQNGGLWGGFGFDIGARPIHCHWACEELGRSDIFTGKPLAMGGTNYDQEGIAGLGVAIAAATLLAEKKGSAGGATAAIQGLGAMGAAVCRYASELGMCVLAIADPRIDGCWVGEDPVDGELLKAIAAMDFNTTLALLPEYGFSKGPLDQILFQKADVLFPCAVQNVIHSKNVESIQSWAVVEGANNPTTPEARQALHQCGIHVIPDIIANPGGAIAAFVELTSTVSDSENARAGTKCIEAKAMTRQRVTENVREVLQLAADTGCSPTDAAHYLAYQRIFGVDT
jgi:glutamate dehydrogenase (NAD(P)+)